jgi:translation initiation factor 2B subunit (eIF-2B alpha/beta/delta family)
MARTAVVAGTATAVSKNVGSSMDNTTRNRQQAQKATEQSQAELEQVKSQLAEMQSQQLQSNQTLATTPQMTQTAQNDLTGKLQQLAQLKQSGVLNEDEFQQAKTRLLTG